MTENADISAAAAGTGGLSSFEIDIIRHRLGLPTSGPLWALKQGAGTTEATARMVSDVYASAGLRNFPLPGRPPVRGSFSTGVVVMTGKGFVVGQRTVDDYRSPLPGLQAEPILTTPDALRVANRQRPGLTPRLFYNEGEKLIITSFEFGVHPEKAGTPGAAWARKLLLDGLPQAMAAFNTMRIPRGMRRHQEVDSPVRMIDRARTVRTERYSEEQLRQTAAFGIDDALLDDLRRRAAGFTRRAPGTLHNDIHADNALVKPTFWNGHAGSAGVCLLDLQFVTEGDPAERARRAYGPNRQ